MQKIDAVTNDGIRLSDALREADVEAVADYVDLHIAPLPGNRTSIAYYEFGDPAGQPLLCLHGLGISGLFFEQYNELFTKLGVRAIAPCLLGGIYIPDPKSIDALASEVIELLDTLGVTTFDVIGFSWGTLVQLALLARLPGRIRRAGLLGAMTPMAFIDASHVAQLKPDVRMTLKMADRMPFVHRSLMALIGRLPLSVLLDQFRDKELPPAETEAMRSGSPLAEHFARCLAECLRTGSRHFTDGWRMFLGTPKYTLAQLGASAARTDVRLYVAENDNVHLPHFSAVIASALGGTGADTLNRKMAQACSGSGQQPVLALAHSEKLCSIWITKGAGRVACMLYFEEALNNLLQA